MYVMYVESVEKLNPTPAKVLHYDGISTTIIKYEAVRKPTIGES